VLDLEIKLGNKKNSREIKLTVTWLKIIDGFVFKDEKV
jgi:hypothetical protein